jgi:hypothetical protein
VVDVVTDDDDGSVAIVDFDDHHGAAGSAGDTVVSPDEFVDQFALDADSSAHNSGVGVGGPELGALNVPRGTLLIDRYRLDGPLPTTLDNAASWHAIDRILDRPVHAILLTGPNALNGLDAARRAALVSDPRLAKVLDVGTAEQNGHTFHYVITEPLGGSSLAELVSDYPLDSGTARAIIGEAASAIDAAERRGIHHVALRPDAIRIDDGRVLLTGLGLDADFAVAEATISDGAAHDALCLAALAYYSVSGYWPLDVDPAPGFLPHHQPLRGAPRSADGRLQPLDELVPDVDPAILTLAQRAFGPEGSSLRSPFSVVEILSPWEPLVSYGKDPKVNLGGRQGVPVRHSIRRAAMPGAAPAAVAGSHPNTGRIPRLGKRTVVAPVAVVAPRPTVTPPPLPPQQVVIEDPAITGRTGRGVLATPIVLGLALASMVGGGAWAAHSVLAPLGSGIEAPLEYPETIAPTEPEPTVDPADPNAPDPAEQVRPQIRQATTVDPYGDGERPQNAEWAIDGDPTTYWYTYTYASPDFGGLKPGVGFQMTLAGLAPVHQVHLVANGRGGRVEVRNTTADDPSGGELLATGHFDTDETITFDSVALDSIMLWITELPQLPDGRYRLELRTVTVQ